MEPARPEPRDAAFVRSRSREERERAEALRLHAAEVVARARETTARVRESVKQTLSSFGLASVQGNERGASEVTHWRDRSL
jgi:hypothetical protein